MRTQLELQQDPMWQTLFHKLTPIERDFIIEVTSSVRAEEREACAKIARDTVADGVPVLCDPRREHGTKISNAIMRRLEP